MRGADVSTDKARRTRNAVCGLGTKLACLIVRCCSCIPYTQAHKAAHNMQPSTTSSTLSTFTCWMYGCGMTNCPQSVSPMARDMCSPPGHNRSGPQPSSPGATGPDRSNLRRATYAPAAGGEAAMRQGAKDRGRQAVQEQGEIR
jgi:hypothetical protein